jgi:methylisocitrate lyase
MTLAAKLRHSLNSGRTLWKAPVYDGITARIAAESGFDCLGVSGYNVAASLSMADVGLTTMSEVLQAARVCVRSSPNVPAVCDIDTGYGNAINVMRTVREFEEAGIAGVQIEDQVSPKRCPYLGATPLVDLEEAVGKIRAAAAARRSPDLVISARTDAETLEEAVLRGKAYVEAGADMIYLISKYVARNVGDIRRIRDTLGVPVGFSLFGWESETLLSSQVAELGGCVVGFPFMALTTAADALRQNYRALAKTKDIRALPASMMNIKELESVLGFPEVEAAQFEYLPKS